MHPLYEKARFDLETSRETLPKLLRVLKPPYSYSDLCRLTDGYRTIGICDGVLQADPAPMCAAFTEALRYWAMRAQPAFTADSVPILEMAVLTRNPDLLQQVCARVQPSPAARQTVEEHPIASLLRILIQGAGDGGPHLQALRRTTPEWSGYAQMLAGLLDADVAAVEAGAKTYLKWFERVAKKGPFAEIFGEGVAAWPVLTCFRLARLRDLHPRVESPYVVMALVE